MRIVMVVLVAMSGAAYADNLRDGCPAGRLAGYRKTVAGNMGASPRLDSMLMQDRASLAYTGAFLTSRENVARDRVHVGKLFAAQGDPWGLGLVVTASVPYVHGTVTTIVDNEETRSAQRGLGNVAFGLGWRRRYISSLDGSVLRVNANDDIIGGIRKARVAGAIVSVRGEDTLEELQPTSIRFMFDRSDFTPSRIGGPIANLGARFEYRLELVGCYAPFIHVTASPVLEDVPDAKMGAVGGDFAGGWQITLPATAAVGLEIGQRSSAYIEYGAAIRLQDDEQAANRARFLTSHRIRVGLEWRPKPCIWIAGTFDAYLGAQDGLFLNMSATYTWEHTR